VHEISKNEFCLTLYHNPRPPRAIAMATTPLNVSASDSLPHTQAILGSGIEMQSVFVASGRATPSDAADAENHMLDAIGGALEQGPRAIVDAMWAALPKGKKYMYENKHHFEELPISAACVMDQSLAVISKLMEAFPDHIRKKSESNGRLPLHWAAKYKPSVAVMLELLKAYPEAAREKDNNGQLPLQMVLYSSSCSNVAVILVLLSAYPDALLVVDFQTKCDCLSGLSRAVDLPCSLIKSLHPLHASICLSAELKTFSRSQRSKDIRLANGADENAADLEQFACAIARCCKEDTSSNGDQQRSRQKAMDDCLQLAADSKLKFFISEPACSHRIEELWWEKRAWFGHGRIADLVGLSFAWYSGWNFIFNIAELDPPPLIRFLMNRASYFAFLVCLLQLPVLAAPGDPVNNISLEIFLAYWLFDICFSEAAEFLDIMKKHRLTAFKAVAKYAEDPWNMYDIVALSTAVAAAVVRGCVHAGVGDATAAASNQLYAWALALLWGRLVNVLSVVSFIGPLLIMVLAMVFRDLTKFAFLVVLMELPFVAALYFLESGDGGNEAFATFPDSALSFFKIVIGQGPDVSSVTASSSVGLLSIGSVLLSVLLLNLLIAMFSKTFDTIIENSTQEYLLQKAQLTFTWARAPRMPPPVACALALKDWAMNMVARHVDSSFIRIWCAGWRHGVEERVEPPPPTFDRNHFFKIVFGDQDPEEQYEAWCKEVLADLAENAEFNSEEQMDKFKSRMLRGMETTVESSGKIDQIEEQVKALSQAVQSQHAQIQQMHASVQLILKKLNP
jgi:hypothetical protein